VPIGGSLLVGENLNNIAADLPELNEKKWVFGYHAHVERGFISLSVSYVY